MEVASAIQRGRETFAHKTAGTSSNSRHQSTRPNHSLAPMLLCSTNGHLREGSSGPESSELRQEGGPTVDNNQANPIQHHRDAISAVSVDDNQGMQQDPPPDIPASEFPSRQVSETPDLQRWSWANARDKQRRERGKRRMTLTKLCSVRLNLSIVQG